MSLEIIGSGFGRTGTTSLKLALEHLGFGPCHHMEEILHNPSQVPHWQALTAGQTVDWNQVFAGYRSQVDWPGSHWWRELAAAFPQAKVIHSVRPADAWWKSFSSTINKLMAGYRDFPLPPHIRDMMQAAEEGFIRQTFGAQPISPETGIAAFNQRTADVQAALPASRVLVFDVSEGWEPLCGFLGVPVPDEPFPRLNSTEQFWQMVRGPQAA